MHFTTPTDVNRRFIAGRFIIDAACTSFTIPFIGVTRSAVFLSYFAAFKTFLQFITPTAFFRLRKTANDLGDMHNRVTMPKLGAETPMKVTQGKEKM